MRKWSFSSSINQERLNNLQNSPSFEEIAHLIVNGMSMKCAHVETYDKVSAKRFLGCIEVQMDIFDLFFNSENGYRGSYFHSPENGLSNNRMLLDLLIPKFLDFQNDEKIEEAFILKSLSRKSAKCWLAEVGKGFCPKCEGEWSNPIDDSSEIINGRWEVLTCLDSRRARKAPFLKKIRILGAFIDENNKEHIDVDKVDRHHKIHRVGWA